MKNKIIAFFLTKYPDLDIQPDRPFADYGIDSLEILDVLMELEAEIGMQFPDDKLTEWTKLQDILDYVEIG